MNLIENPPVEDRDDIHEALERCAQLLSSGLVQETDTYLTSLPPSLRLIVLSRLTRELRRTLFEGLPAEVAADYLHDIPEIQALRLLERIEPSTAAVILEELPKDEQADFVGELTEARQASILAEMPPKDAAEVRGLIEFSDEEAGGLMTVEFVAVDQSRSVADVIRHLQRNASIYSDYEVQYLYVIESRQPKAKYPQGKLQGVLRLRDLLLSESDRPVVDLMIRDPLYVGAHTPLIDLHQFFVEHDYLGVPVVDDERNLIGVLQRGDVEEAMAELYADDYLKSQGIVDEELRTMPLLFRSRRRLAWLSINIVLNIAAASVIAFYQETLVQVVALAVFLPIISDMSGCSGNQAVAVSMRELSLGLVKSNEVMRIWMKEIGVGIINGLCLGLLIAGVAFLWKGNVWLGAVVGFAMMVNTIIAVSLGGTLPLIMRFFKMDPALASGPILTTVTDMCGFLLVLSCASLFLDKLV